MELNTDIFDYKKKWHWSHLHFNVSLNTRFPKLPAIILNGNALEQHLFESYLKCQHLCTWFIRFSGNFITFPTNTEKKWWSDSQVWHGKKTRIFFFKWHWLSPFKPLATNSILLILIHTVYWTGKDMKMEWKSCTEKFQNVHVKEEMIKQFSVQEWTRAEIQDSITHSEILFKSFG